MGSRSAEMYFVAHPLQAIGVQGTENGVAVTTKNPKTVQQPAKTFVTVNYGPSSSNRK